MAGPVDRAAVVGGAPAGAVDVDGVGRVADGARLDQVGHVGLVEHAQAGHARVVGDARAAHAVVAGGRDLARAPRAVAVEPVVGVARVGEGVVAAEVVARLQVLS